MRRNLSICTEPTSLTDLRRRSGIKTPNTMIMWLNNYSAATVWSSWGHYGVYTVTSETTPLQNKATPWGFSELFQSFNQFTAEVWKMRCGNRQCTMGQWTQIWNYIIGVFLCITACLLERQTPFKPLSMQRVGRKCSLDPLQCWMRAVKLLLDAWIIIFLHAGCEAERSSKWNKMLSRSE